MEGLLCGFVASIARRIWMLRGRRTRAATGRVSARAAAQAGADDDDLRLLCRNVGNHRRDVARDAEAAIDADHRAAPLGLHQIEHLRQLRLFVALFETD